MKSETEDLLRRFNRLNWFHACGSFQGEEFSSVRSKATAVNSLVSRKWDNFATSLANRLRGKTLGSYGSNDEVNAACDAIYWKATEAITAPLEVAVASQLVSDEETKIKAHERIMFDVLATLREIEFADIVPPLIHVPVLLPIYLKGHLPCGWTGKSPPYDWNGRTLADLPPGKIKVF